MLLITVDACADSITLRLEGHLGSGEVRELARYRMSRRLARYRHVSLDLTHLMSVDHEGRMFLAWAHRRGDTLIEGGATRALVAEIADSPGGDGDDDAEESGPFHAANFRTTRALFSP